MNMGLLGFPGENPPKWPKTHKYAEWFRTLAEMDSRRTLIFIAIALRTGICYYQVVCA